ncbi:hypothetical protein AAG906_019659 [Vitis piasezkii]
MFTTLTILASMIMFKDWDTQNGSQIVTELCGFVTILSGTFLLHKTKDMGNEESKHSSTSLLLKQRVKHKLKVLDRQTLDILQCYGHLSVISQGIIQSSRFDESQCFPN